MTTNRILGKTWYLDLGISTNKMFFDLSKLVNAYSNNDEERFLFTNTLFATFKFFRSYANKDIYYVPELLKPFAKSDLVTEDDMSKIIDLYMKKRYTKTVMYGNDFSYSKTGITINTRILARVTEANIVDLNIEDITDAFVLKAPMQSASLIYKDPEENGNVFITNLLSDTAIFKFEFIKNKNFKNVYLRKMQNAKNLYEQTCLICNYLNAGIIKIAI